MRKHSARKWLHFVLDLLPILVLPIFAIYEINHDHNTPIEVEAEQNIIVDFNQLIPNRSLVSTTNFTVDFNSDTYVLDISGNFNGEMSYQLASFDDLSIDLTTKFYIKKPTFVYTDTTNKAFYYRFYSHDYVSGTYFRDVSFNQGNDGVIYTISGFNSIYSIAFIKWSSINDFYYEIPLQIFNLTQMFGSGNEPTASEFEAMFPRSDYKYTLSHKQILNVGTETLSNTDIGSQMMYALYKPVKDYFNFNNFFNFGDIYHWFELNMFNGNAPMPIFIVWNIIVYQFLMDLIFLIYAIFMFIIDFSTEVLGRAFDFSRHGGCK